MSKYTSPYRPLDIGYAAKLGGVDISQVWCRWCRAWFPARGPYYREHLPCDAATTSTREQLTE